MLDPFAGSGTTGLAQATADKAEADRRAETTTRNDVARDIIAGGAHVYFTRTRAMQVIRQLDEWEDQRKSGLLAKDPPSYDDSLFARAGRDIR